MCVYIYICMYAYRHIIEYTHMHHMSYNVHRMSHVISYYVIYDLIHHNI